MPRDPVASGEIPEGGPIELLREVELGRVTGVLRFTSPETKGEVAFVGGEIAVEQTPRDDGADPVDVLLSLTGGTYELHQCLPPLAVSRGDDYTKTGSLAVHVPVDLLTYCELAGLTGVLELRHEGRRAEAFYDAGELLAIELDGQDASDLQEVFGWEQGRFRITLDPRAIERFREEEAVVTAAVEAAPEAPGWTPAPAKKREDTRQFLKVVEMALADVMTESEKARSPTRTSPPLPPPPPARPRPQNIPPLPRRRPDDHTIRLIYLTGDAPETPASRSSTRHVHTDVPAEFALTEARPERRADPEHSEPMAKKRKNRPASSKPAKADEEVAPDETEPEAAEAEEAEAKASDQAPEAEAEAKAADEASEEAEASDEAPEEPKAKAEAKKPKSEAEPETKPETKPDAKAPAGGMLGAAAWALAVVAIGLGVLAVLAHLPPVSCRPGREVCSFTSGCVDLASDPANCGACGHACPSGTCQYGECAD